MNSTCQFIYYQIKIILLFTTLFNVHSHIIFHRRRFSKPNIIVMIADDLGWNDVSYHGSNQIPTPNIDALAYNGVILRNHYVLPICTPSRTAFFTGRYPIRDGMYGYPLKAGEPRGIPLNTTLLPQHLRNLGYSTHIVGKWHTGYQSDDFTPARRGFETFFGYYNGYISYFDYLASNEKDNVTGYDMHRDNAKEIKPDWSHTNKYATDVFTDEAIKVIDNHNSNKPLYLQISHLAPHSSDQRHPLEVRDMKEVNRTFGHISDISRRQYAGMVSALDESVGRVVEALSQNNMLENSIILFMSDNGAQTIGFLKNHGSNYPFRGLKFTLYEGGVHGVACVYSPLIKYRQRVSENFIHITDWLPTLYSAAGGHSADLGMIDGVDQWLTISRRKRSRRHSLLVNIDDSVNLEAAIIGQYKLLKGASPEYDSYYGENVDDDDPSTPAYDLDAVSNSLAGQAIARVSGAYLSRKQMLQLRSTSKIICKPFSQYSNCSDRCLFDLTVDPCETTDISQQYPEVVRTLEDYIDGYRRVLLQQNKTYVDPNSLPYHFGGVWMPWLPAK
ncbi:arylsulfatase B-like isoform X2 [Chelonus insularis]|uniref:arylsulfatase B-like isoform X2 n=1 Tax=Chelonus insularis TaxID=460826 RepID=UPI00158C0162|nr:arylsulfatase B-like isoform X2 [Chelonus insularis]